jgi:hypothetical protein
VIRRRPGRLSHRTGDEPLSGRCQHRSGKAWCMQNDLTAHAMLNIPAMQQIAAMANG